jgi:hypothetical protein
MIRSTLVSGFSVAILLSGAGVAPAQKDVLSARNFDHVLQVVRATGGETYWMTIPWIVDPYEACKRAATEGKPLFVWGMAGEPLGTC